MILTLFDAAWMATTLSCALVAGLVLGFAIVVMPGIAKLSDQAFLQAFKRMDGIIQDGQPVFMVVWVGSIVSVVSMLVLGTLQFHGGPLYLMWFAGGLYLCAVQPRRFDSTFPEQRLQALEIESLSDPELAEARKQFEAPWNAGTAFEPDRPPYPLWCY